MVTGCPKGRLAAKSELSPRTSGDFCYNIVSCRPAGRLVIIWKEGTTQRQIVLVRPLDALCRFRPRVAFPFGHTSRLCGTRAGASFFDAAAAMTGRMEAVDVQCAGSKKSLRHMQVVAREARARVRGRARAALCRRRQHRSLWPPLRRLENRPLRHCRM